jgi:hypothetical protein
MALASSAQAAEVTGGASIAGAVPLPIGETHITTRFGATGDYDGIAKTAHDFWRVGLKARDSFVINVAPTTAASYYTVCFLEPGVDDFTFGSGSCFRPPNQSNGAGGRTQLSYKAPKTGDYVLMMSEYIGGSSSRVSTLAYSFNASVRHATQLVLSIPRSVNQGSRFALKGLLRGIEAPEVVLIQRRFGRGKWQNLTRTTALPSKDFTVYTRLPNKGGYTYRATFAGDRDFLPSQASKSIVSR